MQETKPYNISKMAVIEAYEKSKSKQGNIWS